MGVGVGLRELDDESLPGVGGRDPGEDPGVKR
jgi:hypothetical protein